MYSCRVAIAPGQAQAPTPDQFGARDAQRRGVAGPHLTSGTAKILTACARARPAQIGQRQPRAVAVGPGDRHRFARVDRHIGRCRLPAVHAGAIISRVCCADVGSSRGGHGTADRTPPGPSTRRPMPRAMAGPSVKAIRDRPTGTLTVVAGRRSVIVRNTWSHRRMPRFFRSEHAVPTRAERRSTVSRPLAQRATRAEALAIGLGCDRPGIRHN